MVIASWAIELPWRRCWLPILFFSPFRPQSSRYMAPCKNLYLAVTIRDNLNLLRKAVTVGVWILDISFPKGVCATIIRDN